MLSKLFTTIIIILVSNIFFDETKLIFIFFLFFTISAFSHPIYLDWPKALKEAFKIFDKNKNGYIEAKELRSVTTTLGQRLTDEEFQEFWNEADQNGDGKLDYNEFIKIMLQYWKHSKSCVLCCFDNQTKYRIEIKFVWPQKQTKNLTPVKTKLKLPTTLLIYFQQFNLNAIVNAAETFVSKTYFSGWAL